MFEKEAEEYVKQNYCDICVMADDCKSGCIDCFTVQAYLASAEPREKQIAELEAEVKEWKDKANLWCKTANLKDHNIMINKELEKENIELKTKKIPQLERRIASIRGSHRVDVKKLNARIEQVERLKKESAELRLLKDVHKVSSSLVSDIAIEKQDQLTKAKEIISEYINILKGDTKNWKKTQEKAEQFLKDCEVEK